MKLENANGSVATVTGLEAGEYEFTLTVKDERNLQSQSSVKVVVKEGGSLERADPHRGSPLRWLRTGAELDLDRVRGRAGRHPPAAHKENAVATPVAFGSHLVPGTASLLSG